MNYEEKTYDRESIPMKDLSKSLYQTPETSYKNLPSRTRESTQVSKEFSSF